MNNYLKLSIIFGLSLLIFLTFIIGGCVESKTIRTNSSKFESLNQRQELLAKYITFTRDFKELEFVLIYNDNSGGMVPGPSDWDIKIFAKIHEDEIKFWINGDVFEIGSDVKWINEIPNFPKDIKDYIWYKKSNTITGIDRKINHILYWNKT